MTVASEHPGFSKRQTAEAKRIATMTQRLEDELGLSGYLQIRHVYDIGQDGDFNAGDIDGNPTLHGTCAITTARWQYRSAQIRWFLPVSALIEDDALEQVAIHEYIHVLMQPVSQLVVGAWAKDLIPREELATESIARMVMHARGMKDVS